MPSTPKLRELPLASSLRAFGARFGPFAGWEMATKFPRGTLEEHKSVVLHNGVSSISHMGRLLVSGRDAAATIRRATTYDITLLGEGEAHYTLFCNDNGGILDDAFGYRLGPTLFLVVNNAANAALGRQCLEAAAESLGAMDVTFDDVQSSTVMLSLQGPHSAETLAQVLRSELPRQMGKRRFASLPWLEDDLWLFTTGYTRVGGFEIITSIKAGLALLHHLVGAGVDPYGLEARDTLRLEAALPLHGRDIDASTTVWEARLGFAVSLDDGADFTGREALAASQGKETRRLVCLQASQRGMMRHGQRVIHNGDDVATLTSGGMSVMLRVPIGMGYLPRELAKNGTRLTVMVGGEQGRALPVEVVRSPFYPPRPPAQKK